MRHLPVKAWAAAAGTLAERYYASLLVYVVVGGVSALVEWAVFYFALNFLDVHYVLAALIGFAVATLVNYGISRRYAFIRKQDTASELFQTCLVSAAGLAVNLGVTIALIELFGAPALLAKIAGTGAGFLLNFTGRQFWVFDSKPRHGRRK
jgi:putative flippase GtrA